MDETTLTLRAAGELLRCEPEDVLELVRRGDLLGVKIPRRGWFVHRDDVAAFVSDQGASDARRPYQAGTDTRQETDPRSA